MAEQSAVTLRAEVVSDLVALFAGARREDSASRPRLTRLPGVHFARIFLLPGGPDASRPSLVHMADIDGGIGALPRFVRARGGAYFFLPGLAALRCLVTEKGKSR